MDTVNSSSPELNNTSEIQTVDAPLDEENASIDNEYELIRAAGGDVEAVKSRKLDLNQLTEVRKGIQSGVDVTRYWSNSVPWMQMEELRLEMEQNIDMSSYRKMGFNLSQITEIREGLHAGIEVSEYASKDYFGEQMRQIRLGLEAGLPVVFYKDPQYDWNQMEEIRQGLVDNVDISNYAKPSLSYTKMHVARESLAQGIVFTDAELSKYSSAMLYQMAQARLRNVDISSYMESGFDAEQIGQIIIALAEDLKMDDYFSVNFRAENLQEIRVGLEENLDVSVYGKPEFNWQQMREIRKGLENRLDVSVYAKPLYQPAQMREIRKGLQSGLDVSRYSSMVYTARDMRTIRERMEKGEDIGALPSQQLYMEEDGYQTGAAPANTQDTESYKTFDGKEKEEVHYLKISPDNMKAYLMLPRIANGGFYTVDFVIDLLRRAEITFGLKRDVIKQMIASERYEENVLIAEGVGPKFGKDGYYEYFFDNKIPSPPEFDEDGAADYTNVKYFQEVNAGDKLAVYHKALAGSDGMNIKGVVLPGKNGREQPVLKGRGFMLMPDGKTYCAAISGTVRLNKNELNINNLSVFEGSEYNKPQVIEDNGTVWVKGDLPAKSRIKAKGDVVIDGIAENTEIEAGGDVIFRRGANGLERRARVVAGGNVFAGYISNLDLEVGKSIYCNSIMNCNADVDGEIMVYGKEGTILGGELSTQMGVNTAIMGNEGGHKTIINVGVTSGLILSFNEAKRAYEKIQEELNTFNKELKRLDAAEVTGQKSAQWKVKISMAVSAKQKELDAAQIKVDELKEKMAKVRGAAVRIRDTIYLGSILMIDGLKVSITATRSERGGIVYQK